MSHGFIDTKTSLNPRVSSQDTAPRLVTSAAELTPARLAELRTSFETDPHARLLQNAAVRTRIEDVALSRAVSTNIDFTFSHVLDDWSCTNQKQSGRCWMFAGLNLLRVGAMKKMNLGGSGGAFEFSQAYTQFWDKLERANYFLESVIDTSDRPADDRTVAWLLDHPIDDGGQWNMFVALVHKHGLVPQAVMPETASSSCTRTLNAHLLMVLRQAARTIRELCNDGVAAQRAAKDEAIATVHRILCLHLGTPPEKFDWQWNDKDRKFHRDGVLTPQQFAAKYVTLPLDDYVCLVNDPRPTSPLGRTFTVDRLGNVVGGAPVRYLNVPMSVMKDIAMRAIVDGEPVWFGCDVGKMMHRDLGLWDAKLYDLDELYDTTHDLSKADRLIYHATLMTHAMLFTGVDVVESAGGLPGAGARRWRVENSWGDEAGRKGFFTMNDSWFDEHMFEIAARKQYLPPELLKALDEEPIVLPAWDPMGALASHLA